MHGTIFRLLMLVIICDVVGCYQYAAEKNSHTENPSGIQATMLIGPTCPGPQKIVPDPRCADRPYHGRLAVKSASTGKVVAVVTPNQAGEFRVVVPPGRYFVTWVENPLGRKFQSSVIQVTPNQITSVHLHFDTLRVSSAAARNCGFSFYALHSNPRF